MWVKRTTFSKLSSLVPVVRKANPQLIFTEKLFKAKCSPIQKVNKTRLSSEAKDRLTLMEDYQLLLKLKQIVVVCRIKFDRLQRLKALLDTYRCGWRLCPVTAWLKAKVACYSIEDLAWFSFSACRRRESTTYFKTPPSSSSLFQVC